MARIIVIILPVPFTHNYVLSIFPSIIALTLELKTVVILLR